MPPTWAADLPALSGLCSRMRHMFRMQRTSASPTPGAVRGGRRACAEAEGNAEAMRAARGGLAYARTITPLGATPARPADAARRGLWIHPERPAT